MAPEALSGLHLREGQAKSLDVYSYAIVLWEIWARVQPWNEVKEEGVQFSSVLAERVLAGVRPRLLPDCPDAPVGYRDLMEQCWAGQPDRRPTFAAIVRALSLLDTPQVSTATTKM
jgi:hypothetical protein